ncbi:MAG: amidohydrolase [Clostridia bacterium]|nr:amidohydrolase [Clostridia bacterium]
MELKELKRIATDAIDESSSVFCEVSDMIWEYAELSLKEYKSTELYVKVLAELGFEVERNVAGIATAFLGKAGSGRPYIGILGEYDALSGLSQVGGSVEKCEVEKGGNGHGCGHNMLGAGALAAAYGVKRYLEATGKSGTVIFFGTPGEEGGAGKAFMAKSELWRELDSALTWHPMDVNEVTTGTCNSCLQVLYKYRGVASHAAGDPEHGRSALDAVELMNTGVQYLREHTKDDARIHYAIIDGGGFSPNVVQPTASVLYMVRSKLVRDANALLKRVDKIADGAALMTETEYERVFIDGCSGTVPNHALEALLYSNLCEIGVPEYTDEEWEYAKALKATYDTHGAIPSLAASLDALARAEVEKITNGGELAINNFVAPLYTGDCFSPGSTDVGDVSWQTPTAQVYTACFTSGAPGHSWQNVSVGKTSIGHKGLILAGKVIAAAAVELFECPEKIAEAKAEFENRTKGGYVSPIPDGEYAKPVEI